MEIQNHDISKTNPNAFYGFITNLFHLNVDEFERRGFTSKNLRSKYAELLDLIIDEEEITFLDCGEDIQYQDADATQRGIDVKAWKLLSAYVSADREGVSLSMDLSFLRERMSSFEVDKAVHRLRKVETRVIECIRIICEMCIYGEDFALKSNDHFLFEYFCDKNIVSLLVDIASCSPSSCKEGNRYRMGPVTWSTEVKSQILRSFTVLFHNIKRPTSIFFLLSNNYISDLLLSFIPWNRFTRAALENLIPEYVSLLKILSLKLQSHPTLFEFLTMLEDRRFSKYTLSALHIDSISFPLFTAAVTVVVSRSASVDPFGYMTALSTVAILCQNSNDEIRKAISNSANMQVLLFDHLCDRLALWCNNMHVIILNDALSSKSQNTENEVNNLRDQLHFINGLFLCGIKTLNVRLCEFILKRIIYSILIKYICSDSRVEPKKVDNSISCNLQRNRHTNLSLSEAQLHTASIFLSQCFFVLDYKPILKMICVAIFHCLSPKISQEISDNNLTTLIHKVATNDHSIQIGSNLCRNILIEALRGNRGNKRFMSASLLMHAVIRSKALIEDEFLLSYVLTNQPVSYSDKIVAKPLSFGGAISLFAATSKDLAAYSKQLDVSGSLIALFFGKMSFSLWSESERFVEWWKDSNEVRAAVCIRSLSAHRLLVLKSKQEISPLFIDLFQSEIFQKHLSADLKKDIFPFNPFPLSGFLADEIKELSLTDIGRVKILIRLLLRYSSLCENMMSIRAQIEAGCPRCDTNAILSEPQMSEELIAIGGIQHNTRLEEDLNLVGRMCFLCYMESPQHRDSTTIQHPYLLLVVDSSMLYTVSPYNNDESRGKIVFASPFQHVISTMTDDVWLHIAIRPSIAKTACQSGSKWIIWSHVRASFSVTLY